MIHFKGYKWSRTWKCLSMNPFLSIQRWIKYKTFSFVLYFFLSKLTNSYTMCYTRYWWKDSFFELFPRRSSSYSLYPFISPWSIMRTFDRRMINIHQLFIYCTDSFSSHFDPFEIFRLNYINARQDNDFLRIEWNDNPWGCSTVFFPRATMALFFASSSHRNTRLLPAFADRSHSLDMLRIFLFFFMK